MAESSWPLPPNAVVSDTQYEQLLLGYTPSGVMGSPGDTTIVTAPGSGTRIITIRLGKYALVRGHLWYSGTSDFNMASLAANSSGNPRIDLVSLRYTRSTGAVTTVVTTGTPAASPVAPTPLQNLGTASSFEIPVAQVAVANGATTITTGNITSRETYLSRTPLLGSAAPTTATPGVYLDQDYHQYDSTSGYRRNWWWNGSTWQPLIPAPVVNEIATSQTSGSVSYTDLGTVGPTATVPVGPSGIVEVTITSQISNSGGNHSYMGYAVSGANTIAATDTKAIYIATTNVARFSGTFLLTGLTAGSTTFTAKYKVGGGTGTWLDRAIHVKPY